MRTLPALHVDIRAALGGVQGRLHFPQICRRQAHNATEPRVPMAGETGDRLQLLAVDSSALVDGVGDMEMDDAPENDLVPEASQLDNSVETALEVDRRGSDPWWAHGDAWNDRDLQHVDF